MGTLKKGAASVCASVHTTQQQTSKRKSLLGALPSASIWLRAPGTRSSTRAAAINAHRRTNNVSLQVARARIVCLTRERRHEALL
jgi:hypothetical protein